MRSLSRGICMIVQYRQTEAVGLLNEVLQEIVIDLKIPVMAIAGNHG